jgi:hypothetical protein
VRSDTPCLVCGQPDPLGLPVCPACGGTSGAVADQLVFAVRPTGRAATRALRNKLAVLAGRPARSEAVEAASLGLRAIARVPRSAVPELLARLEDDGIRAHVADSRAWGAIPFSFLVLLGLAVTAGMVAGLTAVPALLWMTPVFMGTLIWSAVRGIRQPLCQPLPRAAVSPGLVRALNELPPGQARDLIADLAQVSREVLQPENQLWLPVRVGDQLEELLPEAARVASDVAALDQTIADFEARAREGAVLPETFTRGLTELRAVRVRLSGYLLEVTGLVGRLQGLSADGLDSAGDRLTDLVAELRDQLRPADLPDQRA